MLKASNYLNFAKKSIKSNLENEKKHVSLNNQLVGIPKLLIYLIFYEQLEFLVLYLITLEFK